MTDIINKSFQQANFPQMLKTSKLTPVHKGGPYVPGNFRPINQLSIFSKIIEKAAKKQLTEFMELNHPNNTQFGFKPNHSTLHPIILTRHELELQHNNGNYTVLIMCDKSKAFDTINSDKILPSKLAHYGATPKTVKWFKSFFTDRIQYVTWEHIDSEPTKLHNISVVQGSNLGPPMFNLYIQDLPSITKMKVLQYADDTILMLSRKNINTLIKEVNKELENVYQYL